MSRNGHDKDFKITQDNISQVRASAENEHSTAVNSEANPTDQFYDSVNQQSERIQHLVEQIGEFPNPAARSLLAECMEAVLTLHGNGLERILQIIDKTTDHDIKEKLLNDDFIKGLLLLHGLHPEDLETRLYRALEKVKPYMDSHGGSVQVVSLKNGVATIKLEGSCDGCPSSSTTLELGIKEAIEEECPDLKGLEVEGLADNPLANEIRKNNQKNGSDSSNQKAKPGYSVLNGLENFADGEKKAVKVNGTSVMICRVDGNLYAYENECPGCGQSFDTGRLEGKILSCKLGHDFDVQQAGKCPDDADIHLNPFPLIKQNGAIKIAVG